MPELPEVELARRNLARWLEGKRIRATLIPKTRIVRGSTPEKIERLLDGRTVTSVERRGKWLRIALDRGALFSHLGMTGKWVRREPDEPAHKSERARIDVEGASVRYQDPRLFGRLVPSPSEDGAPIAEWQALGPDPLVDGLDPKTLAAALSRTRRSIKEALMDQSVLAGVGNIQANEALWRARIDPRTPAAALDDKQLRALVRGIDASIAYTLKTEAGPEITYVEEPGAKNPFRVYGKTGQPCPRCAHPITRLDQAGRGTFLCPHCQRGHSPGT
jgi:formamidopyrimidine-DNA glycosylase